MSRRRYARERGKEESKHDGGIALRSCCRVNGLSVDGSASLLVFGNLLSAVEAASNTFFSFSVVKKFSERWKPSPTLNDEDVPGTSLACIMVAIVLADCRITETNSSIPRYNG